MSIFKKFFSWLFPIREDVARETQQVWMTDLNPLLVEKVCNLLEACAAANMRVGVHKGYRSVKEQDRLYAIGRTTQRNDKKVTNARGGQSWHNFGLAVDVVFMDDKGWSWAEKYNWKKLGILGKKCGLSWGGDWKKLVDRPHFQLTGDLSIGEAYRIEKLHGIESVWARVNLVHNKE